MGRDFIVDNPDKCLRISSSNFVSHERLVHTFLSRLICYSRYTFLLKLTLSTTRTIYNYTVYFQWIILKEIILHRLMIRYESFVPERYSSYPLSTDCRLFFVQTNSMYFLFFEKLNVFAFQIINNLFW